ncbi:MAG: hypothetical protein UX47_C0006G0045 [Candidatus Collierbacteria bacterium GW2011_GWA2_46_26]|uniref:Uncharacterized protein n=1 Tax=Candidatus Collierbacteria bacterium GW2011_GWA2_46_26 TaxID=1618381 RepID=A0A0G1PJS8_9BACT|nr:MAG: hypothetical protein UX47_C0006G0045 [Candidatus Collierbacteria bacterium GW2011_GWA2_46_26]
MLADIVDTAAGDKHRRITLTVGQESDEAVVAELDDHSSACSAPGVELARLDQPVQNTVDPAWAAEVCFVGVEARALSLSRNPRGETPEKDTGEQADDGDKAD